MNRTAWLARRAVMAIALMIGFYVLAVAIAAGLLWVPYAEWVYLDRVDIRLAIFAIGTATALIVSVMPRADDFKAPGPLLDEQTHAPLFALIREVATDTGQQVPAEVYLVGDVNAWVAHRGGVMGFGSRQVMGLGLPLMQGLTVSQLKAVLAHEFGHYAAGDVKLGPWIYKTRAAIGRTLQGLGDSWLFGIFNAYGNMFLRLTHAISREQEFLADAVAARTVHPSIAAAALQRVEGLVPAYSSYWQSEVAPALNAGVLPPLAAGFHQYLQSEHVSSAVSQIVQAASAKGESRALDTHPPLRERLAALGNIASATPVHLDDRPAAALLGSADEEATRLLEFAAGADKCQKLRRVEWAALATEVYPAQWRAVAAHFAAFLAPFTADGLPADRAGFVTAGRGVVRPIEGNDDLRVARACHILAIGVAVALLDAGASAETAPGQPMLFRRGEDQINPFSAISQLAAGTQTLDAWKAECERFGIAGIPLGDPSALLESSESTAAAASKNTAAATRRRRGW